MRENNYLLSMIFENCPMQNQKKIRFSVEHMHYVRMNDNDRFSVVINHCLVEKVIVY